MTEEYLRANGLVEVKEYNIHKEVRLKFCKKCLSPLPQGASDFCDFECRKEYSLEIRRNAEEVYYGMRNGD